nr:uncharacterized protein LOC129387669 [Dermacentor andersoni]
MEARTRSPKSGLKSRSHTPKSKGELVTRSDDTSEGTKSKEPRRTGSRKKTSQQTNRQPTSKRLAKASAAEGSGSGGKMAANFGSNQARPRAPGTTRPVTTLRSVTKPSFTGGSQAFRDVNGSTPLGRCGRLGLNATQSNGLTATPPNELSSHLSQRLPTLSVTKVCSQQRDVELIIV